MDYICTKKGNGLMIEKLQNIFVDVTGKNDIVLSGKTKIDDIAEDSSFIKIQLICAVEDAFDVEVPNSELKKLKTVQDLLNLIESLQ